MPAMHFRVRWPDQTETRCYSPSLVIKDYFAPGTRYPLADFMPAVRDALHIASERVRAKYGFACSAAMDQLADIERLAAPWSVQPDAWIEVLAFDE